MSASVFIMSSEFAIALIAMCFVLVWQRARHLGEGRSFLLVMGCELALSTAYLCEQLGSSLASKLAWDSVQLLLDGLLSAAFVRFAFHFARRPLPRWWVVPCLAPTVAACGWLAVAALEGTLRTGATLVAGPIIVLTYPFTTWDYVVFFSMYVQGMVAVGVLAEAAMGWRRADRAQAIIVNAGVIFALFGGIVTVTDANWLGVRDLTPFFLAAGSLVTTWSLLRQGVFRVVPVAYEVLLESLDSAVIVIDAGHRLCDANPTARSGLAVPDRLGTPLGELLPEWDEFGERLRRGESVRRDRDDQKWEFRARPIEEKGWMVVATDVTAIVHSERVLADANAALEHRVEERTRELVDARAVAQESEGRFRAIFDNSPHFMGLLDLEGQVLAANRAALDFVGLNLADVVGKPFADSPWWTDPEARRRLLEAIEAGREGRFSRFETVHSAGGKSVVVDFSLKPVVVDGEVKTLIPEGFDVTETRAAEAERLALARDLQHTERLDMLGRLAGGVAHDFNNLLAVIVGSTSALELEPLEGEARELLQEIAIAAESATALTRQLLAFSRSGPVNPRTHDANEAVSRIAPLVRRLIGERYPLRLALQAGPLTVHVDPGLLEQCVMNLVVNARDAMADGGTVTLTSRLVRVDSPRGGVQPGEYVALSVADTGTGMSDETRANLFRPFFTTKGAGRGTGLGLATVDSIVKEAEGFVDVDTTPGLGSTFTLHLPHTVAGQRADEPTAAETLTGTERIAVVEDVAALRHLVVRELRHLGYDVHAFESAEQMLAAMPATERAIDVLVTDVILPGMNGVQLAEARTREDPALRVVFVTGYPGEVAVEAGVRPGRDELLPKPFRPRDLAAVIRRVMGPARSGTRPGG